MSRRFVAQSVAAIVSVTSWTLEQNERPRFDKALESFESGLSVSRDLSEFLQDMDAVRKVLIRTSVKKLNMECALANHRLLL